MVIHLWHREGRRFFSRVYPTLRSNELSTSALELGVGTHPNFCLSPSLDYLPSLSAHSSPACSFFSNPPTAFLASVCPIHYTLHRADLVPDLQVMLYKGEKYACDACVRGHRVSNCQHAGKLSISHQPTRS